MAKRTHTSFWRLLPAHLLRRTHPRSLRFRIADLFGFIGFCTFERTRRHLIDNLEVVLGSRRKALGATRRLFSNYSMYLADYMLFPTITGREIESLVSNIQTRETLQELLAGKKGVILVTPHLGNWELAGLWVARNGFPLNVVSLTDEDPRTEAYRHEMRRHHGIRLLRYDPETTDMKLMTDMVRLLRENQILAMLTDRPTSERNISAPFFGREAPFPAGAFLLSWFSGAPVVPCACVLKPDRTHQILIGDPIRPDRSKERERFLVDGVHAMAATFETFIRRHPDQWYNFSRYWK